MSSRPRRQRSWLFSVFASLALAAQFVVAIVPLAEGRQGRSMSAHVESGTTKGHYAHNEATCASCQARSMHGTTAKADISLLYASAVSTKVAAAVDHVVSATLSAQTNPRAPPSVV